MSIPAWVAGETVVYTGYEGATVVESTLKAVDVSATFVELSDTIVSDEQRSFTMTFTPGTAAAWGYQFWVDPADPAGSIVGPEGEKYSVKGTETYDGVAATVMQYSGPDATGEVVFQTATGLILEESATYPDFAIIQNLASAASSTVRRTVNADGSYDLLHSDVTGQVYSSYEDVYNAGGSRVAEARDNKNGTGGITLYGDNLKVAVSSTQEGVQSGPDLFVFNPHFSNEAITQAPGTDDETFVFGPAFGKDAISGFLAAGAHHDTLQFDGSMFSYLTAGMTEAQQVAAVLLHGVSSTAAGAMITDSHGDSLTLDAISKTVLAAHAADFKFV
jgi:hypothetical protein